MMLPWKAKGPLCHRIARSILAGWVELVTPMTHVTHFPTALRLGKIKILSLRCVIDMCFFPIESAVRKRVIRVTRPRNGRAAASQGKANGFLSVLSEEKLRRENNLKNELKLTKWQNQIMREGSLP